MKRGLVLLMITVLTVGSVAAAEAGKGKRRKNGQRTVEREYAAPGIGTETLGGACPPATNSCPTIPTRKRDRFVKVSIADAREGPVPFHLSQPSADEGRVFYGPFCDTTGWSPIRLETPGAQLQTHVWTTGDTLCTGGITTTGTITIVLFKRCPRPMCPRPGR